MASKCQATKKSLLQATPQFILSKFTSLSQIELIKRSRILDLEYNGIRIVFLLG